MKLRITVLLAVCVAFPAIAQPVAQDNQTQIVVQWPLHEGGGFLKNLFFGNHCIYLDQKLDDASGQLYDDDGNDIGEGLCNIYLYSSHVAETVSFLANLEQTKQLPPGMRIGVARYTNKDKSDWVYIPAYPAGLTKFTIGMP